LILTC
jgi:hypothetical protein